MQDGKINNERIKTDGGRRDAAVEQARRAVTLLRADLTAAVGRESEEAQRTTELLKAPRVEGAIKKDPNAAQRRAELLDKIDSRRNKLESTRKEIEEAMKEFEATLGNTPVTPVATRPPRPVTDKPAPTPESTPESTPEKKKQPKRRATKRRATKSRKTKK